VPHLTGNSVPIEEPAGDRHAQEQGTGAELLQRLDHELEAAPFGGPPQIGHQLLRLASFDRSLERELFVGVVRQRKVPADLACHLPVVLQPQHEFLELAERQTTV